MSFSGLSYLATRHSHSLASLNLQIHLRLLSFPYLLFPETLLTLSTKRVPRYIPLTLSTSMENSSPSETLRYL